MSKYKFGSKNYPGIKKGEIFISTISTEFVEEKGFGHFIHDKILCINKNLKNLGWKTARVGEIAYISSKKILKDRVPVFIKETEYNKNKAKLKGEKMKTKKIVRKNKESKKLKEVEAIKEKMVVDDDDVFPEEEYNNMKFEDAFG